MFEDQLATAAKEPRGQAFGVLEPDWTQPELRRALAVLDVNMNRFSPLVAEKEESEALDSKHDRHSAHHGPLKAPEQLQ